MPVNLDFVRLVEINMLENVLKLFYKNVIIVSSTILYLLFLIIFAIFKKNRKLLNLLFKAAFQTVLS